MPVLTSNPDAQRPLSFGERAVGLTFNPGGDPQVHEIKKAFALAIDILEANRTAESKIDSLQARERIRMLSIAISEAQTAQMWGVKAITWN